MALTDFAIENAMPKAKAYELGDGGGLYLQVNPSETKLWRMKYRWEGREKKLAIGPYPLVSLADARTKAAWIGMAGVIDCWLWGSAA
ncbi:hypothetical protein GCM10011494_32720 [Novosphingobium endophyticum]|uniref:Integrase DNA-binding domain-containing protein n=1 Tax=Novosphingobium endophyticum TaxID=1955250 RepID=A0A916TV42_9SPHN|nr:Arm DNA-binding domain-containing protein [Novosphingobium endophyticum]GGC11410.1 hypothetical protein GCM10011494_32720 [Novosphingobium endophyticum]